MAQLPAELVPAFDLGEQPPQRLVGPKIEPACDIRRRPLEPICVPQHLLSEFPYRLDRVGRVAQPCERRQRAVAKPFRFLHDALRLLDRAPPKTALDKIDRPALEPGERRAQEAEEIAPSPASPGEAQQRGERMDERRLCETQLAVHGVGNPE